MPNRLHALCVLFGLLAAPAFAWDDHSLVTLVALDDAGSVKVETLESFLTAEKDRLPALYKDMDDWARAHLEGYPAATSFDSFAAALHLNPHYRFEPLLQRLTPDVDRYGPRLANAEATLIHDLPAEKRGFVAPAPGTEVPARLVAATAADEPDYGPDLGLFSDNGTDYGAHGGFGPQPFGNPQYTFSSQSPFHMGFYHESWIIYAAAPFLKRCYPELRLHQYLTLARFAFAAGHPYWGWRFTGLGLHYVQDLTQPYHSIIFPGMSTAALLWVNARDLLGFHHAKEALIQVVNNRHLALENYVYVRLARWFEAPSTPPPPVVAALLDRGRDDTYAPWSDRDARDVVSAEAWAAAPAVDEALTRYLPERLVSDPDYIFSKTEPHVDVVKILAEGPPEADTRVAEAVKERTRALGTHTRRFAKAAQSGMDRTVSK